MPDGSHGGYSERIVLPSLSVTRMPSNGSFARGAAFLSNALTAEITLEHLALEPGQTLAVTGATGAVGGYLVQLAAARGITVIWVEHVLYAIMNTAPRIMVLHRGELIADGAPATLAKDPAVIKAYLGEETSLA